MSYPLRQFQISADYIVRECQYQSDQTPISKSHCKYAALTLLQCFLTIKERNPKMIVVHPTNHLFQDFFSLLQEDGIEFPDNTAYLLTRKGMTFKRQSGVKTEIFNHESSKNKAAKRKHKLHLQEIQEQLAAMSLSDSDIHHDSDSDSAYTPYFQHTRARSSSYCTDEHKAARKHRYSI